MRCTQLVMHFCLLSLLLMGTAQSAPLMLTYIDKPPYYYTDNGQPQGFLLLRVRAMLDRAGIAYSLQEQPPKRILQLMQANQEATCSIGWFKTAERTQFAQFSLPIHRDAPMLAIASALHAQQIRSAGTVTQTLARPSLKVGIVDGYAYGDYLDNQFQQLPANRIERTPALVLNNLLKITRDRIDLTFVDREEWQYLKSRPELTGLPLEAIELSDLPPGKERFLMCSQLVPTAVLNDINQAIRQFTNVDRENKSFKN